MKKSKFVVLLAVALLFVTGCGRNRITSPTVHSTTPQQQSTMSITMPSDKEGTGMNECRLIVNEKDITPENHLKLNFEFGYAEIPLIAVLKELGADILWSDSTNAKITIDGICYYLNIKDCELTQENSDTNILGVPPGCKHSLYYIPLENEIIIDSDSSKLLLSVVLKEKIIIDADNHVVSIEPLQQQAESTNE